MEDKLYKFLEELKELQNKYDMYIQPECDENWEEDCNGDMYYYGSEPYLVVYDEESGAEHIVQYDFFI